MGVGVDLIEPMGFIWEDRRVRRSAMDYIDHVEVVRHAGFGAFRETLKHQRLILFTTKAVETLYNFNFAPSDVLMFGQESGGVPPEVSACCDARLKIPIRQEVRSFNLATSVAIAVGESLRQTGELPA